MRSPSASKVVYPEYAGQGQPCPIQFHLTRSPNVTAEVVNETAAVVTTIYDERSSSRGLAEATGVTVGAGMIKAPAALRRVRRHPLSSSAGDTGRVSGIPGSIRLIAYVDVYDSQHGEKPLRSSLLLVGSPTVRA